ncbi:MAG: hypothetical protein KA712_20370 [Myxococcales bacterium]|nr:hypothetical protein [Myxococcales bacterium]
MDAVQRPMARVREAAIAFANDARVRLTVVESDEALRPAVLTQFCRVESVARPPAVMLCLETPFEADDANWPMRGEELLEEWKTASGALVEAGQPPLSDLPGGETPSIVAFSKRLQAMAAAAKGRLSPVVLLAPLRVAPGAQERLIEVHSLVSAAALEAVRWVVVTPGPSGLAPVVAAERARGPFAAELVNARVDSAAGRKDLAALVAGMKSAPAGATPMQMSGFAGPSVAPPRRVRDPAPMLPEQRTEATLGVPPGLTDTGGMHEMRVALLEAAVAAGDGRFADAVIAQRAARDVAVRLGLVKEAAQMELLLGSYVLSGGEARRALELFTQTAGRAEAAGWGTVACQAGMARGSALAMLAAQPELAPDAARLKRTEAGVAYLDAGRTGARLKAPAVAIEAYRLGGDMLAALGEQTRAVEAWTKAIEVAEAAPPADVAGSSALELAHTLRDRARATGRGSEAAGWQARAEKMARSFAEATAQAGGGA